MGAVLYPPTEEIYLRVARLGLAAILSMSMFTHPARAAETPPDSIPPTTVASVPAPVAPPRGVHTASVHPVLRAQMKTRKVASVKFWEAVAWCETHHNWQNGGYYSGGLGMAQSVWVGWGGREFASKPYLASKEEQIIVANRAAFLGWQTKKQFRTLEDKLNNRPFFRHPVKMPRWGKDCVNWKTRKPLRDRYTEAGRAEWNKSKGR